MKLTALCAAPLLSLALAGAAGAAPPAPPATAVSAAAPEAPVAIPAAPSVPARQYILIDYANNTVLAQQGADVRAEPASLTKLMTAYVVFHALKEGRLKLDDTVTISEHAWRAEGSRTFAQVGSRIPAEVLIKGMIVQSGNDATIALAEHIGGTEQAFVQLMNEYAQRLGMMSTHYDDSTGLPSPTHYTTARDIATLSAAIIRDFPQYYPWFAVREFTWNNIRQQNRDGLLERDPSVDGLKTGHTDSAGYCLASSAKRQDTRLISVVLGSNSIKDREGASAALLNYGFTFYETVTVRKKGDIVLKPRVYKGAQEYVTVGPAADIIVTIPRGQNGSIATSAQVQPRLIAPLDPSKPVGNLQVSINGKLVTQVPLYPLMPVAKGGLWSSLSDSVLLWTHK